MSKKVWQAPVVKELNWDQTMSGSTKKFSETPGGECAIAIIIAEEDDVRPQDDGIISEKERGPG